MTKEVQIVTNLREKRCQECNGVGYGEHPWQDPVIGIGRRERYECRLCEGSGRIYVIRKGESHELIP